MRDGLAIASGLLIAFAGFGAAPAQAQGSQRVLTIFGNDKCPTSNGEEVVVCKRLPETDRFRIPEQLRTTNGGPTWASRSGDLDSASRSGVGSCSVGGGGPGGGSTGCELQQIRNAKAERKQNAQDVTVVK